MIKKPNHKKIYIAIFLVVVLCVSIGAIIYTTQTPKSDFKVGVKVGQTFTYQLSGDSILFDSDAVPPAYLPEYNQTSYYQVTITGVTGSVVSFNTIWQFINGTSIDNANYIDLKTGDYNPGGYFWAIFPSNLKVNNRLYPEENNTLLVVNSTGSQPFSSGARPTNYWSIEKAFTNINNPTGSTQMLNIIEVYFDKQTGMPDYIDSAYDYNNPNYNIIITWQLTNSTVWSV
jgi:hypothetical protein